MVRQVCASWGLADRAEAAQLVMTELVSNAVRHARTELRASLVVQARRLLVAVRDRCVTPPRLIIPGDGLATGGRGMTVVAALASCWGCMVDAQGKEVWVCLSPADGW
jgi:anti-sigma regulatory factor (Ser/Thr protein kinase)